LMGVMTTPALASETHSESTAAASAAGCMLSDWAVDGNDGLMISSGRGTRNPSEGNAGDYDSGK
jgi:hypothetical protein